MYISSSISLSIYYRPTYLAYPAYTGYIYLTAPLTHTVPPPTRNTHSHARAPAHTHAQHKRREDNKRPRHGTTEHTDLLLDLPALDGRRGDGAVTVTALQQRYSGGAAGGVGLKVHEEVLVEHEPAQLPLAQIGRLLVEEAGDGVLLLRPAGQVQQLAVVEADPFLHAGR